MGMIEFLGQNIDGLTDAYVGTVLGRIIDYATRAALLLLTVWGMFLGMAVARSEVNEPANTVAWKYFKMAFIVALATSAVIYQDTVVGSARGLSDGMVTMFAPPGSDLASADSIWSAAQAFDDKASDIVSRTWETADFSVKALLAFAAATTFSVATAGFLIVVLSAATVTRVVMAFGLVIGPFFILCLMFKPTAQFFFNWLGLILSSIFLNWITFFVVGFSMNVTSTSVETLQNNFEQVNILAEASTFLILAFVLALLIFLASGIAARLGGGSAIDLGTQMVTQIMYALKQFRGGNKGGEKADGGNVIQKNQGLGPAAAAGAQRVYERIAAAARSRGNR
jgi:type IV secretion system protein VirB6